MSESGSSVNPDIRRGMKSARLEEWMKSARKLGKLAVQDSEALAWLLAEVGPSQRRFYAALAAYQSEGGTSPEAQSVFSETIAPLLNHLLELFMAFHAVEIDWARIPWVQQNWELKRTKLTSDLEKMKAAGNANAIAAKESQLAALELVLAGGAAAKERLCADLRAKSKDLKKSGWLEFSCYMGGTRVLDAASEHGVFPLTSSELSLAIQSLQVITEHHQEVRPVYMALPNLLLRMGERSDSRTAHALLQFHMDHENGASGNNYGLASGKVEAQRYNLFCCGLNALSTDASFRDVWSAGVPGAPEEVCLNVGRLLDGTPDESAESAHRIIAMWFDALPDSDAAYWMSERGQQARLMAFLLVVNPPEAHRGPPLPWHQKSQMRRSIYRFSEHYTRVQLILKTLSLTQATESTIRTPILRTLNMLMEGELDSSKTDAAVLRRHAVMIRPLLDGHTNRLRTNKDLAGPVARLLDESFGLGDEGSHLFFQVLYTIFSALPSPAFFEEVHSHVLTQEVRVLLERTQTMLEVVAESWEDQTVEKAEVERIEVCYQAYTEALKPALKEKSKLSGEGLWSTVNWIRRSGSQQKPKHLKALLNIQAISERLHEQLMVDIKTEVLAFQNLDKVAKSSKTKADDQPDRASWQVDILRTVSERHNLIQGLVEEIHVIETDVLAEKRGSPSPTSVTLIRWGRMVGLLKRLETYVVDYLPCLERELIRASISEQVDEYQRRIDDLSDMIENENEDTAIEIFRDEGPHKDRLLAEKWMKSRYMFQELAEHAELPIIGMLTRWYVVLAWIAFPFVAAAIGGAVVGRPDHPAVYGWFFASLGLSSIAIGLIGFELRASRKKVQEGYSERSSLNELWMPQITGALLLGILDLVGADEPWYTAIADYPVLRIVTIVLLLCVVYAFIKSNFLGGQIDQSGRKHQRTLAIMSMGLWQSFCLTLYFGIAHGWVMFQRMGGDAAVGGSDPGGMPFAQGVVEYNSTTWGLYNSISVELLGAGIVFFPWALLSWTVQLFFFSAILERIMNGQDAT